MTEHASAITPRSHATEQANIHVDAIRPRSLSRFSAPRTPRARSASRASRGESHMSNLMSYASKSSFADDNSFIVYRWWKALEQLAVFQLHTEFYAILVGLPTILWVAFQALSQAKIFEEDFNKWHWYNILFYTIDSSIINSYLLPYCFYPILLAYFSKRVLKLAIPWAVFVVIIATWSTLASALLRRWVPLETLLVPLYLGAIIYLFFLAFMSSRLHLLKWWKVIFWYFPFLFSLFLIDVVIIGVYFQYPQTDNSFEAQSVRLLIRVVVVPIFTALFTFTGRVVAIYMDDIPNNQRLATTVAMVAFRSMIGRVLVANAGSYTSTFTMLTITMVTDTAMRLTSLWRDFIMLQALYFIFVWPVEKVKGAVRSSRTRHHATIYPAYTHPADETSDEESTAEEGETFTTTVTRDPDSPEIGQDPDSPPLPAMTVTVTHPDSPEIHTAKAENAVRHRESTYEGSTSSEESPDELPADEPSHAPRHESDAELGFPLPGHDEIEIDNVSNVASQLSFQLSANRVYEFEQDEIAHSKEVDLYQLYTGFITNESIMDSSCIISVTFITFGYNLIFGGGNQNDLVHAAIVCAMQVIFAVLTDAFTILVWALPQLVKGRKPVFLTVWHSRAHNILAHLFLANVCAVLFFTYRVFLALNGTWHK
ncbi:hypothetical protein J8273_8515 [Carpediemonas membranifera]|uniref:Uncharacterized protein n=1 Tax=Carpediemonas membranifera TaxID=201153 RepID=A0A8J6APF3_9EUKA|nr:hypothetical protein J8273_8515 [Carpediemonas membranifera]|eukprot:KAG9389836.1 hypothetical protein J8273_8515 [Carpediemonas membranifera]